MCVCVEGRENCEHIRVCDLNFIVLALFSFQRTKSLFVNFFQQKPGFFSSAQSVPQRGVARKEAARQGEEKNRFGGVGEAGRLMVDFEEARKENLGIAFFLFPVNIIKKVFSFPGTES